MSNAFHYQNTFDDELAQEFRRILSLGFDPKKFGNLSLWLDANNAGSITADGNQVSQWDDLSGSGNHAVQASSSNQPVIQDNVLNNLRGIYFDGLSSFLTIADSVDLQPEDGGYTVFTVFKPVDLAAFEPLIHKGNAGSPSEGWSLWWASDDIIFRIGLGGTSATDRAGESILNVETKPYILSSTMDGSTVKGYLAGSNDGWIQGGGGPSDNQYFGSINDTQPLEIGIFSVNPTYYAGHVTEILIYKALLTEVQRGEVETYLADKWGLYHPNAAWIAALPAPQQVAVHAGKLNKDEL